MRGAHALIYVLVLAVGSHAVATTDGDAVGSNASPQCPFVLPLSYHQCRIAPSAQTKLLFHDNDDDATTHRRLRRPDPHTIQNKFLVGYQGWFTCAGDGKPVHSWHHGWLHWANGDLTTPPKPGKPGAARPGIDFWPDFSSYPDDELHDMPGLHYRDGSPARVFSSRHATTVRRHWHWMAEYGVDGAFVQRFATELEVNGATTGARYELMSMRDRVLDHVRAAADAEDRVFAIMYDLTGLKPDLLNHTIAHDWTRLMKEKRILDSPNYLREDGRPVIALWGVGFVGSYFKPADVEGLVRYLRLLTPGGAYIIGGVPTHWAALWGDQLDNEDWLDLYYDHFDAISPWTVGRYDDMQSAEEYGHIKITDDLQSIKANAPDRKIDYMPVVFPGMSAHYLSNKKQPYNWIKREGGDFLWRQVYNAKQLGARIIYGAMWDEYDEGTAFMPVVSAQQLVPSGSNARFYGLDIDKHQVPSDWYMRMAGIIAEAMRGEFDITSVLPRRELEEFFTSRPHYATTSRRALLSPERDHSQQLDNSQHVLAQPRTLADIMPMTPAAEAPNSSLEAAAPHKADEGHDLATESPIAASHASRREPLPSPSQATPVDHSVDRIARRISKSMSTQHSLRYQRRLIVDRWPLEALEPLPRSPRHDPSLLADGSYNPAKSQTAEHGQRSSGLLLNRLQQEAPTASLSELKRKDAAMAAAGAPVLVRIGSSAPRR